MSDEWFRTERYEIYNCEKIRFVIDAPLDVKGDHYVYLETQDLKNKHAFLEDSLIPYINGIKNEIECELNRRKSNIDWL